MECPKCKSELKIGNQVIEYSSGQAVSVCFRCESCWTGFSFGFSGPWLENEFEDKLRLVTMDSAERWNYFKCKWPNADVYTNVAKRGRLATRKNLETLGLEVIDEPNESLPGFRLYEVR